jgi:hypothetical protein
MTNPIPFSGFFDTPTLEALQARIEGLPAKDKALVYTYVTMALNACHAIVEDEFVDTLSPLNHP